MEKKDVYTGYKIIQDSDENLPLLYEKPNVNTFELLENQYLVVIDGNGNDVDAYKWQKNLHRKVQTRYLESAAIGKIKPLNVHQKLAIDMLLDTSIGIKALGGTVGSGKETLMVAAALSLIQNEKFERICWCRNNFEVRDTKPIGALPGSLNQKLNWLLGPLMDALGGCDSLNEYMDRGLVEIQHLAFIRGRDLRNVILYCTEAENLTRDHLRTLIGRIASGSSIWLNGDAAQKDAKVFEDSDGFQTMIDRLKGNPLFSYVYMPISVRSEIAKLADLLI